MLEGEYSLNLIRNHLFFLKNINRNKEMEGSKNRFLNFITDFRGRHQCSVQDRASCSCLCQTFSEQPDDRGGIAHAGGMRYTYQAALGIDIIAAHPVISTTTFAGRLSVSVQAVSGEALVWMMGQTITIRVLGWLKDCILRCGEAFDAQNKETSQATQTIQAMSSLKARPTKFPR